MSISPRAFRGAFVLFSLLLAPCGGRAAAAAPDAELQEKINAAVDKGVKWLRAQQRSTPVDTQNSIDGGFGSVGIGGAPRYQMGLAALCGLALLAAGVSRDDPVIKSTTDFLKRRDEYESKTGRTTYGASLLIMFLTEVHRPKAKESKYAKAKEKDPCNLSKETMAWVQDLANWLITVQDESGLWRYPQAPPPDLSNSQYALLGLRAARDCGAEVSSAKFLLAMNATLARQEKEGTAIKRIQVATHPGEKDYVLGVDHARGWNYQGGAPTEEIVDGSMTTAAIAILAIARDALLKPTRSSALSEELDHKVAQSVQDGFAWLDLHFTVERNPPSGNPAWQYYYLYGLERAGALAGREMIGKHDWYLEGARYLVDHQKEDGRWSTGTAGPGVDANDLCETAWAILFLKKATRPTVPVKPPVITTSDEPVKPPEPTKPPAPPPVPPAPPAGMSPDK